MAPVMDVVPGSGLFDRVQRLFEIVLRIPDDMSDEETRGVIDVMPPDVADSLEGFFNPRVRRAGIALLKMVGQWLLDAREAKASGKKVILVPFNFVPEFVHAFENAVPLTSEFLSTLGAGASEGKGHRYWDYAMGLGIPDHLCSASTIELGSMLTGSDLEADAVISCTAGACDANSKIHEFVANYLGIPQFILEKPVDDTERGIEQYRRNFFGMVEQVEEFVGERISEERLRDVVENCNRAAELHYQLWELKKNSPCPVPNIFNMFIYGARFTKWGRPEAVRTMQVMVDESKRRLAAGEYPAPRELARCGWLYTGYYIDFAGLFNWMEEQGYSYLFDVLDLFFPEPISTESRETMLQGICDAARTFPMTRQMGAGSMSVAWIEDAIHIAREMNVNCGIFCGHHACKQTWSVISIVQKELMERIGAPTLCLQGDAWLSGMTPMSALQADIDEFIRNVVIKKRRGKARTKSIGAGPRRMTDG
jgi:benzoyl-CoA reductase/2-hydroxyglutaryl-CoA dehydratase subunit BcrC/BadD/HgdB